MDAVQRRILDLLSELDDRFEASGVRYCLADRLAWDCLLHGRFVGGCYQSCVLVAASDLEHLDTTVDLADREFVEDATPADGMRRLRYVSSDTTVIWVESPRTEGLGVCVELLPVRPSGKGYEFVTGDGRLERIGYDPLQDVTQGLLEGRKFALPQRPQRYLSHVAGPKWKTRYGTNVETSRYGTIIDMHTPYRSTLAELAEAGIYDARVAEAAGALNDWRGTDFAKSEERVETLYDEYRFVTLRYKMCEKYLPHKQVLLDAWKEGRKDEVCEALREYIEHMKAFYHKGKALHFDDELFDLAVKALLHSRWKKAVFLPFMVDSKHRKDPLSARMAPYLE